MLLILLACSSPEEIVMGPSSLQGPQAFEAELDQADQRLLAAQERAETLDDYSADVLVAGWAQQRARLSGDYADYATADAALAWAFEQAPEGGGPFLARAQLDYSLHRVDRAPADLDAAYQAVLIDDNTLASLVLMEANLDFQQGRYADAVDGYEDALSLHPSIGAYSALATAHYWLNDLHAAHANLDAAEALYHGFEQEPLAWFDLQRGIWDLERGQLDAALAHFHDADAHLGGYWLVQEHIAEIWVLQGFEDHARPLYEDIVDRTGSPEFMDALAGLTTGDEAAEWEVRAEAVYLQRLEDFPEASWGHALDHYLETAQPERALELAERNAALRPNGASFTQLAEALLLSGRPQEAAAALQPSVDAGWTSADAHWVLHLSYAETGQQALAETHRAKAVALNPGVAL